MSHKHRAPLERGNMKRGKAIKIVLRWSTPLFKRRTAINIVLRSSAPLFKGGKPINFVLLRSTFLCR
jgi:hypothetical protein